MAYAIGFTFHMITDLIFGGAVPLYPIIPYALSIITKAGLPMDLKPTLIINFQIHPYYDFHASSMTQSMPDGLFSSLSILFLIFLVALIMKRFEKLGR